MGLAELRRLALDLPEAIEKISHGRPTFCAPKMFAVYGGSSKVGQADGAMVRYPYSVLLKIDESERRALEQDPRFFFPMYLGPFGWLGLNFEAAQVNWDEVGELVDASYRLQAPRRLIRELDAR